MAKRSRPDQWLTVAEAAELSGYNEQHIRRLIRSEKITAQKFGIVWQVSKQSLTIYLKTAKKSKDRRHGPKGRRLDRV